VVRAAARGELAALLALIADYQLFYGNPAPDEARNEAFFGAFVAPSERGMLLGAFEDGAGRAGVAGFACLYWTFSSVSASDVVLLNDLYVHPEHRGTGVGKALLAAAAGVARERGASHLRWFTQPDNHRAQRLYERVGAPRSTWYEYEIALRPAGGADRVG
jgi:GNAT superfamily N-acetyltransferase